MASAPQQPLDRISEQPLGLPDDDPDFYPTSDGRPMAETDLHRDEMVDGIETLRMFHSGQQVYVSGNILRP
jgi:hypothetical protein